MTTESADERLAKIRDYFDRTGCYIHSDVAWLIAQAEAAPAAPAVPDGIDLWSFLRNVLKRGASIESQFSQQGYETFISEIEAAARSEDKSLRALLAAAKGEKP